MDGSDEPVMEDPVVLMALFVLVATFGVATGAAICWWKDSRRGR